MKVIFYLGAAFLGFLWGYYCIDLFNLQDDCIPKISKKFQIIFSSIIGFGLIWSTYTCRPYERFVENFDNHPDVVQKESKYEAIVGNKVEKYIKCYNKNGHNICEADDEKFVVDDYWKIDK